MKIKNLIFESIGTILLTFSVGMSISMIQGDKVKDLAGIKALSFFMIHLFLFPIGKNISGCHLNPVVSLSFFFAKKIDAATMISYIIV